jgi:tetratricopeptide (TPR) repeat protein
VRKGTGLVQKSSKRARPKRRGWWIFFGAVAVSVLLLFWIGRGLYPSSPEFYYLLVEKNDQPLRLLNGDKLQLHPQDNLRIVEISTNILLNVGVRLEAKDLDVTALQYEKLPFSALLPGDALLGKNQFRITVKRYNVDIGSVDFVVEPFVEDWLEKAERTINPERRLEILEEAKAFAPGDKRIKRRLLEEYKSLKKWDKAAQLLEEMIKEEDDPKLLLELLEVYESTPNPKGVISVLNRLLAKDPNSTELRFKLARTLEKTGKRDEAIKQYEMLLEHIKPEEKLTIYKTLGYLYSNANQVEKAIAIYLKAIDLDKKDVNLYYNLSGLYEKAGDKNRANQYLSEAAKLNPDDLETRLNLAENLIDKGNLREAENHLAFVLQKKPDSVKALVLMTNVLEKQGDKKRLKVTYEKLLLLDPNNEILIYNLGVLQYETGDYPKSILSFERYVKLHPQEVSPHRYLFDIYKKQKKDDLAFAEAKTLVSLNPKEMNPYDFIFEYLNSRGSFKEMADVMKIGVSHLPDNTDLHEYLILAYLKIGNDELALREMNELLKLKPKDVSLLLQVAELSEKQGKDKEALAAYKRILEISPDNEEAQEAYLRLRMKELPLEQGKQ